MYPVLMIMHMLNFLDTFSMSIQLRFPMTCKLSLGIQKSIDFDGFLDEVDFVRLFIQKYKYYSHQTISHKPLRFCHSLPNPCLPSSCPFQISSSFSLLNSSKVYIYICYNFLFFLPILFSCMISCLFLCHVFCFQFLVFFTDFLFMICCFFGPIFLYAMFFFISISCFF